MSSAADHTGGAPSLQSYFCHQCNRTVRIAPPVAADPVCPICGGSFVEELELSDPTTNLSTNPNPNPNPGSLFSIQPGVFEPLPAPSSSPPFISSSGSFEVRSPGDFAGLLGIEFNPYSTQTASTRVFDPQLFVRDHIESFFSGGANIQVVFENAGRAVPLAGNMGDYVFGSGLEHLIQQLFENDPNRYGPPPAAKSAMEALPIVTISEDMVAEGEEAQCAVCKDAFETGTEAVQLPCKHIYHKDCIFPWLQLHNSCPVCRYELPTDDPDYAHRVRGAPSRGGQPGGIGDFGSMPASAMGGEERSPGRRTVQRRVRISLPWPFRGFGTQAEGSRNTGQVNDSSSSASRDDNFAGQQNGGSEPRQEDLD